MTAKIYDSSPKAKAFIENWEDKAGVKPYKRGKRIYPWNEMKIGQSFVVSYEKGSKPQLSYALRNSANQKKIHNGKRFIIVDHPEHKLYEVARIA